MRPSRFFARTPQPAGHSRQTVANHEATPGTICSFGTTSGRMDSVACWQPPVAAAAPDAVTILKKSRRFIYRGLEAGSGRRWRVIGTGGSAAPDRRSWVADTGSAAPDRRSWMADTGSAAPDRRSWMADTGSAAPDRRSWVANTGSAAPDRRSSGAHTRASPSMVACHAVERRLPTARRLFSAGARARPDPTAARAAPRGTPRD